MGHCQLIGQLKLKHAKVAIIGAGGLGCPVLQYISAAGVGMFRAVSLPNSSYGRRHRDIRPRYRQFK